MKSIKFCGLAADAILTGTEPQTATFSSAGLIGDGPSISESEI